MAEIGKFHEEATKSGVIVVTGRLNPTTRVRKESGKVAITDGPFIEGKELIPGFTIIRADNETGSERMGCRVPGNDGHARTEDRRDLRVISHEARRE